MIYLLLSLGLTMLVLGGLGYVIDRPEKKSLEARYPLPERKAVVNWIDEKGDEKTA